MKKTLLIPSMMDDHMPFLRYALASKDYEPVVLDHWEGLMDAALRYAHNDMCYPFHLALGQYLTALESGQYDPDPPGSWLSQPGLLPGLSAGGCPAGLPRPAGGRRLARGGRAGGLGGLRLPPHSGHPALRVSPQPHLRPGPVCGPDPKVSRGPDGQRGPGFQRHSRPGV